MGGRRKMPLVWWNCFEVQTLVLATKSGFNRKGSIRKLRIEPMLERNQWQDVFGGMKSGSGIERGTV